MTRYIALLRGINVSGHNLIRMADLRQMFEAMGFGRVQTYIQSGNVLFDADEPEQPLRERIEQQIAAVFHLTVPVVLRTAAQLAQIPAACPFAADALAEGESLYVALLAETPAQAGIDRLSSSAFGTDEYRVVGREVYLLLRQPAHKTKLTNNLLEQRLGVTATSRNWQTIHKLIALAAATT